MLLWTEFLLQQHGDITVVTRWHHGCNMVTMSFEEPERVEGEHMLFNPRRSPAETAFNRGVESLQARRFFRAHRYFSVAISLELQFDLVHERTNTHSTTSSISDTAVYTKPSTAVPELKSGFQWKQDASAAQGLAKSGQGYPDSVERQVLQ